MKIMVATLFVFLSAILAQSQLGSGNNPNLSPYDINDLELERRPRTSL
jgi:hypothetical protein